MGKKDPRFDVQICDRPNCYAVTNEPYCSERCETLHKHITREDKIWNKLAEAKGIMESVLFEFRRLRDQEGDEEPFGYNEYVLTPGFTDVWDDLKEFVENWNELT